MACDTFYDHRYNIPAPITLRSLADRMADHHYRDFTRVVRIEAATSDISFEVRMEEWLRWVQLIIDTMTSSFTLTGPQREALFDRFKTFLATVTPATEARTPELI